jgi:hypothetical protein
MAAVAALGIVTLATTAQDARAQAAPAAQTPAPPAKKAKAVKDTNEYDIYNKVIIDASPQGDPNACKGMAAAQAQQCQAKKFLTDLDTWTEKYPNTDFKDNRTMFYVQAYAANAESGKSLAAAKGLIDMGIDGLRAALDNNDGPVLQGLFLISREAAVAAAAGTATPDELATGAKAAHMLMDFGKVFFAPDKKPASMPADQWAAGLKQIEDQAEATLFQVALFPGVATLKKNANDPATCAAAEAEFKKTLEAYPQSGQVASQLAAASRCQQSTSPEKVQQALYLYARAVVDPVGGVAGLAPDGQKALDTYLKQIYVAIHGSDDGLADLKVLAAKSPLPPADFKVKTASEIAAEKEEEFRTKNPQLAVWLGIKGKLADTDGQAYFDSGMKGSMMAGDNGAKFFKGTLLEAKPACRPKELLVAFPLPGQQGSPVAEVTIKVVDDQMKPLALTGKPETGGEIQFNGAPSAFTKEPFMLTLDAQKTDIDGLNMTPCAATKTAPAQKKKGE